MKNLTNQRGGSSYILATDEIAVGANKVMLDLFNAAASKNNLLVTGIYIEPKSDVAVTGAVSARFDLYRTSTAGTGGTANSYRSPSPAAINIVPLDSSAPALLEQGLTESVISGIRARSAPSGGASPKHWLFPIYAFPEETSAQAVLQQGINCLPDLANIEPLVIAPGEGLMIQQGSVASVGNFVFVIAFSLGAIRVS